MKDPIRVALESALEDAADTRRRVLAAMRELGYEPGEPEPPKAKPRKRRKGIPIPKQAEAILDLMRRNRETWFTPQLLHADYGYNWLSAQHALELLYDQGKVNREVMPEGKADRYRYKDATVIPGDGVHHGDPELTAPVGMNRL
jgi:DNA-binding transcriptional ArsR family regulator